MLKSRSAEIITFVADFGHYRPDLENVTDEQLYTQPEGRGDGAREEPSGGRVRPGRPPPASLRGEVRGWVFTPPEGETPGETPGDRPDPHAHCISSIEIRSGGHGGRGHNPGGAKVSQGHLLDDVDSHRAINRHPGGARGSPLRTSRRG